MTGAGILLPNFKVNPPNGKWQIWGAFHFKIYKMTDVNFTNSITEFTSNTESILNILHKIKNGEWEKQVTNIRKYISEGDDNKASDVKKSLPAFTVSATFKDNKRKKEHIDTYTGLLHLDYDKIGNVQELKSRVMGIPYTYAVFISPSGRGLKVFVKSDNDLYSHTNAFNKLREYYDSIVGIESDKAIKDITRLCFVSYDAKLYLNENSDTYRHKGDLSEVWNFTSNKQSFIIGNRNNFIHLFACNANRQGFDNNDVINYALSYSDETFPEDEIKRTINSAFKNNESENGRAAKLAICHNMVKSEDESPFIPEQVYNALPETLRNACKEFSGRERDVFFTSALAVISGGLHNVHGLYRNEKTFPNVFGFISAPPASGKGVMKYAKQLGECYHRLLLDESKESVKLYNKAKRLFDLKVKKAKTEEAIDTLEEPTKPKSSLFFIPGDTSSSMIMTHLEDNDGTGCICETEADTLTKALKQEWGDFTDVIRKGFHSEPLTKSRKTDLEYTEIKEPKFSVALTGTPNQMDGLINSVENGTFSRFMFYSFKSEPKWKSTWTDTLTRSNTEIFEDYSAMLCGKFRSNKQQRFFMTQEQGMKLDATFEEELGHHAALYQDSVVGVVFRLGLMCFKIAMVLTALRSDEENITCTDEDCNTAITLVKEVYLKHAINMLTKLDKQSNKLNSSHNKLMEWIETKDTFKRGEILSIAQSNGIKDRTLTDMLQGFIQKGLIKKVSHGVYSKR